jgi:hypothetical protein
VRAYTLAPPLLLPIGEREHYFSCRSWVQLDDADVAAAAEAAAARGGRWQLAPALADAEFARRQEALRAGLQLLDAQPLAV